MARRPKSGSAANAVETMKVLDSVPLYPEGLNPETLTPEFVEQWKYWAGMFRPDVWRPQDLASLAKIANLEILIRREMQVLDAEGCTSHGSQGPVVSASLKAAAQMIGAQNILLRNMSAKSRTSDLRTGDDFRSMREKVEHLGILAKDANTDADDGLLAKPN